MNLYLQQPRLWDLICRCVYEREKGKRERGRVRGKREKERVY